VRGIHVRLDVLWGLEAAAGAGDTHVAIFHGTKARVEIHQGAEQRFRPELYVVPKGPINQAALTARMAAWVDVYHGIELNTIGDRVHVVIPDRHRISHEAHFGEVARQFLAYVQGTQALPAWEKAVMIAKYHVTTTGVALARTF